MAALNLVAGGTISPSRFCVVHTSNKQVVQAGANAMPIGISMEGSQDAPAFGGGADAATVGELVKLYGIGDVALLKIGTGGITAGSFLKSDATGQGIAASLTALDNIGAIALETAIAGDLALVQIVIFHGALS